MPRVWGNHRSPCLACPQDNQFKINVLLAIASGLVFTCFRSDEQIIRGIVIG